MGWTGLTGKNLGDPFIASLNDPQMVDLKREIFVLLSRECYNDNTTFWLLCGDRASREHKG